MNREAIKRAIYPFCFNGKNSDAIADAVMALIPDAAQSVGVQVLAAWRWKVRPGENWCYDDVKPYSYPDAQALCVCQPSPAATVETISKTDAGELLNTIAAQADMIAKLAAMIEGSKAQPHSSAGSEPVQDTWFTDSSLPIMAASGDAENDRVIKLHFRRKVTDADRKRLIEVLNAGEVSLAKPQSVVWQPIDKAPQDGTRILATGGGLGETVEVVTYNERVGCWSAETCTLDDTDHEPQGYNRPTLWQPMPSSQVSRPHGGGK